MCTEPENRVDMTVEQAMDKVKGWIKPSLVNSSIEYYLSETDDKVQIFSKVDTSFGGPARNFVAEKNTMEEAKDLITRLKKLHRNS